MSRRAFLACTLVAAVMWLGAVPGARGASISVESSLSDERVVAHGETYRGVITVRNNDPEPTEIKVFQTDYSFAADGSNDYGTPGKLPRSNAGWVRVGQEQYRIPPNGKINVQYEVKVPDDPGLQGSYWSLLMVEPLSARESSEPPAGKKGEVRVGLTQVIRFAVQIVSEVGDGGARQLEIREPKLVQDPGTRTLRVDVANSGERLLKPKLLLELSEVDGGATRKLSAQTQRVYPGTSVRFQFDLSAIPAGRYRALVAADAGGDDLFGSEFPLALR